MSGFAMFDRGQLRLRAISQRGHLLHASQCCELTDSAPSFEHGDWREFTFHVLRARQNSRPVILMMGAHPLKLGLSRYLVDLIERGVVTHLAANGAVIIHEYELARHGGTSEDVAKWIAEGQFGLWEETSRLNDIIRSAAESDEGMGRAVGRAIEAERLPYRSLSVLAAAYRADIPATIHVTVGGDIIHCHANCDGAAIGKASYADFLIFARSVQDLGGGVFVNLGSSVTGPEVFLKALSMARNVARQRGEQIRPFTSAVFDIAPLPDNWRDGVPEPSEHGYYFRPWKTILVRTVADGGASFYFCADHRRTVPALWSACSSHRFTEP